MLSRYDKILLDVSGTLYTNKCKPIKGSKEFIDQYFDKITIFSNIGSKTGLELEKELLNIFNTKIPKVLTSLDLLIEFLKTKSYSNIFHYGNADVANKVRPFVKNIVTDFSSKNIDAAIFTSLVEDKWIKTTDAALNTLLQTDADILLANPDRITPLKPYYFTVTLISDSLINLCNILGKDKGVKEFGKPNVNKESLGITNEDNLIVIGDNPLTDIQQAINLNCDSILISPTPLLNNNLPQSSHIYSSLNDLL